jgi:hypothetical protein
MINKKKLSQAINNTHTQENIKFKINDKLLFISFFFKFEFSNKLSKKLTINEILRLNEF